MISNEDDVQNSFNSTTSSSGDIERRLKMDPNYKWLLKDLNLNNNKRVIDVTALLDEQEMVKANDNAKKEDDQDANSDLEEGELLKEQEYSTSDSDDDESYSQNEEVNKHEHKGKLIHEDNSNDDNDSTSNEPDIDDDNCLKTSSHTASRSSSRTSSNLVV